MEEVVEIYYKSKDGKRFESKEECEKYESCIEKKKTLEKQIFDLNKELAQVEYTLSENRIFDRVKPHNSDYNACPHCGEATGGYGRINLEFKVDDNVYRCQKCRGFFRYS